MSQTPLVIIPAAGFGTRVGRPEAKELLPHPGLAKPMIDVVLQRTVLYDNHVITRKEKQNLIEHLEKNFPHVQVQTIEPSREWADTVLKSKPVWREKNLLYLPDTDFSPVGIIRRLFEALDHFDAAFAVFDADDLSEWGVVGVHDNGITIADKLQQPLNDESGVPLKAWGLIAFRAGAGEALFQAILQSHISKQWQSLNLPAAVLSLDSFQDFTR